MAHAQWQQPSEDKIILLGALDRDTVPELWPLAQQWKPAAEQVEVALDKVGRVDSAGMVMLIHLIEHAKKQNCHIMLSFVPEQLSTLFQLSNVSQILAKHIKR
ncbi:STAS domain-containing protein [Vibrio sp.]|uniref:STAS domain-containing protein n=1 Tax=Vibrio sp. TaxID=678 RepID=UPI003D0D908C